MTGSSNSNPAGFSSTGPASFSVAPTTVCTSENEPSMKIIHRMQWNSTMTWPATHLPWYFYPSKTPFPRRDDSAHKSKQENNNNYNTKYNQHPMRLPPLHLATAFISRTSTVSPSSRSLFSTSALNMKSNAATQAEGTVIVGGGIAGLAVAAALRNVAGG